MKKYLIIVAASVVLLLLLGVSTRKESNVSLGLAPSIATAVIDGNISVKKPDLYLKPGKHSVVAKLNGFKERVVSFTVYPKGKATVFVILDPNSSTGFQYLKDNPGQELKREALGGNKYNQDSQAVYKKATLVSLLP